MARSDAVRIATRVTTGIAGVAVLGRAGAGEGEMAASPAAAHAATTARTRE